MRRWGVILAAASATACAATAGPPRARTAPATPATLPYSDFVRADATGFYLRGRTYRHVGANLWQAMNLGSTGPGGDRERLRRELDRLRSIGVTNLRILGASEGPNEEPYRVLPALQPRPGEYDDAVADGLDFALAEIAARGMHAVVCLNNTWPWSGGMAAYLVWHGAPRPPYPMEPPYDWRAYQAYVTRFYDAAPAVTDFRRHVAWVVGRRNRYTDVAYKDEPAIMAWEIANEPRGGRHARAMRRFVDETAALLKELDPNHLVTTGSEGSTLDPEGAGLDFELDHASRHVDYATFHFWAQNWGAYDPATPSGDPVAVAAAYVADHVSRARRLGKPAVLEEFGLARDAGSFDPTAPTTARDRFYAAVFEDVATRAARGEPLAGASFWAWSGEARPRSPGGAWRPGDPLLGDPPHEPQGWYGVYDTDASTLAVVEAAAARLDRLR